MIQIVGLLFGPQIHAEEEKTETLPWFLENVKTLQADFKQKLMDENGTELENASGVVYLHRPGKLRWDYQYPYQQTIVTDGELLWFYDKDLEQATVHDAASIKNTPAAILGAYDEIETHFSVIEMGIIEGFNWTKLIPKDTDSQYQNIRLGFDKRKLVMMIMSDNLNQVTRIDFNEEKINEQLADDIFNFIPPEGIDVLDNRE